MAVSIALLVLLCSTDARRVNARRMSRVESSDLDSQRPEELLDATPLFAGRDTLWMTDAVAATSKNKMMCCCKKSGGKCEVVKVKYNCRTALDRTYTRYWKFDPASKRRYGCRVDDHPKHDWIKVELDKGKATNEKNRNWHAKVNTAFASEAAGDSAPATLKVYLVRHGYSEANEFMESGKHFKDLITGGLKDATLTVLGQDQAVASQQFFLQELQDVDPSKVQLAASLLSRAYDTLVLATALVWGKWKEGKQIGAGIPKTDKMSGVAQTGNTIDQVPALMEFGRMPDVERKSDRLEFAPVHWDDSVLATRGNGPDMTPDGFKNFYDTSEELKAESGLDSWMTLEPWQVRAGYPRRGTDHDCNKNAEQIHDVMKYLAQAAISGKTHAVVGTHSGVIQCFFKFASKWDLVTTGTADVGGETVAKKKTVLATWQDKKGDKWWKKVQNGEISGVTNLYTQKVPNGGTVSFDMEVRGLQDLRIRDVGVQAPGRGYPSLGLLRVRVVRGIELTNTDWMGKSDPYIIMSFGGLEESRSKRIDNNLNPVWNYEETYEVGSAFQLVRIEIWDHGELGVGDTFIGHVNIRVEGALKSPQKVLLRLEGAGDPSKIKKADRGQIEVELAHQAGAGLQSGWRSRASSAALVHAAALVAALFSLGRQL